MTAIVGGQTVPSGLQIDSKVNINRSQNQSWTVPAGTYFEGVIFGQNGSTRAEIDGATQVPIPYNSGGQYISYGRVTLGPGQVITSRNSGTIYIRGVLFNNGN